MDGVSVTQLWEGIRAAVVNLARKQIGGMALHVTSALWEG